MKMKKNKYESSTQTKHDRTCAYIIVCWNNKALMKECIESIQRQTYKHKKIFVVDNASTDGSVEFVTKTFPEVEVLAQDKNYAFAKGNNIGIKKALEDQQVGYFALVNSDATLENSWTSTLIAAAEQHPKAAMLQSITLDYYDHAVIDSTHVYIARNGQATQGSWRLPLPEGYDVPPQKVFGCNAAAMIITRGFIEQQPFGDFFDETMFMYLEDVDIAARATVMGWDNYVIPGTRAYHMGSASSGKNPGFSLYMTFRNNLGLLIKNLPLALLLPVLASLFKADRASIKHLQRTNRKEAVKFIYRGRLASLPYIPIFIFKRYKLKKYRNIDNNYLWNLMRKGF
jgi:GT2 family glycosyltransferase